MDYDLDRNSRKIAEVLVRKVPDDQQVRVCLERVRGVSFHILTVRSFFSVCE